MNVWRLFGFACWALILIAIFTFAAEAKPVAVAGETDTVTLHDTACTLKGWQKAVYRYRDGKTLDGCWSVKGNAVVTVWEDGDVIPIPPNAFKAVTSL